MRAPPAGLLVGVAGVLTFGIVFALLQMFRSGPAPPAAIVVATDAPTPAEVQLVARAPDSLAAGLVDGTVAIGVPTTGSEPLLQGLQPGDRLDVLVSFPSPVDSRPVTAVLVSGVTVVRPATPTDPLLLEVSSHDALILAHSILSDTRLSFVVWSTAGSPPVEPPLDERTARATLGLPSLPVLTAVSTPVPTPVAATQVPPTAAPTPRPTPVPTATPAPDVYAVQNGDTIDSIATRLGIDTGALWWANRTELDPEAPLAPGLRLHVPLVAGFLYQVQSGDTWDSVAATFDRSALSLRQNNTLSQEAQLSPGDLMFIPR